MRLIGEERKGSEGGKGEYGQGETEKNGGKWEPVKEISELTLLWSKSRLPNPPASAVSLSLSISSCRQKGEEKHLRLNCPEVVLFLLHQRGKKVGPPAGGMHRDWAKLEEQSTEE